MALQKNIILPNGLTVENAYIRINWLDGSKDGITLCVGYYVTQVAFLAGAVYLDQKFYTFIPDVGDSAANFIKQGYEHLKTLPEFAGTTDV